MEFPTTVAAFAAFLAMVASGGATAWLYDRLAGLAPGALGVYLATPGVRNYLLPFLGALLTAGAATALAPAQALALSPYAPLIDAAVPIIAGAAGWQGATRVMAARA